jgi:hypothetical protein
VLFSGSMSFSQTACAGRARRRNRRAARRRGRSRMIASCVRRGEEFQRVAPCGFLLLFLVYPSPPHAHRAKRSKRKPQDLPGCYRESAPQRFGKRKRDVPAQSHQLSSYLHRSDRSAQPPLLNGPGHSAAEELGPWCTPGVRSLAVCSNPG